MARIIEETVIVKFSKIVKTADNSAYEPLASKEVLDAIEMMADNTVAEGIIVEVTKSDLGEDE